MVDTLKAARWLRRSMLPLAVILGLALYWNFGWISVPVGMDTMPGTYPAGSLCLVLERPSRVLVGMVVFVDMPQGGTLLARISAVRDAGIELRADNPNSNYAATLSQMIHRPEALRAQVLTALIPEVSRRGR